MICAFAVKGNLRSVFLRFFRCECPFIFLHLKFEGPNADRGRNLAESYDGSALAFASPCRMGPGVKL
ncbi:hypothetical protein AUC71_04305 [Methyloceanibacter marginalis]|uniref:Uncharacterized protein n=1 Tax=Methyloceanibacter marginalis TaxID=1774971 RepID=A0A1E3VTG5_9HYPH|nr:hypothetical protein AUC71_04305 [Methyloceanibacter marginalis]